MNSIDILKLNKHKYIVKYSDVFIKDIQKLNNAKEIAIITSLKVAEMVGIRHDNLLKKIDGVTKDFADLKVEVSKYWKESTYKDSSGKENRRPQFCGGFI